MNENSCTSLCRTVPRAEHSHEILVNVFHKRAWHYLRKSIDDAPFETKTSVLLRSVSNAISGQLRYLVSHGRRAGHFGSYGT